MYEVSVVIPVFNQAAYVREAIESALAQSRPPYEVIVVDDGSTDETPAVVATFGDRVRLLRQPNAGVAAARNAGAALARGDLLAFLDADDAWMPAKLERQCATFAGGPELGLVHCGIEIVDGTGRSTGRRVDGMEGRVAEEMLLFRRGVILGGGSAAVVTRRAFEEVGGFDADLSTSADWDLHFRIARRYAVGFVPEPLVRYRVHGSNMHGNIGLMERDMTRAYEKAFRDADPALRRLQRRAYAALHSVLAGSFFRAGHYSSFARHAARSILYGPDKALRFLAYPLRVFRRWRERP